VLGGGAEARVVRERRDLNGGALQMLRIEFFHTHIDNRVFGGVRRDDVRAHLRAHVHESRRSRGPRQVWNP
jgi:hypothetical protein